MSEMQQLQKQIQKTSQQEEQQQRSNKRKDDLDQEDVMVDEMQKEGDLSVSSPIEDLSDGGDILDTLELNPELFHELGHDEKPPMLDAIHIASQFLEASMVFRALADGDPVVLQELKTEILTMVENGLQPQDIGMLERFSGALGRGIEGLDSGSGAGETELQVYEVEELKSIVDSSLIASDAMHSEIWEEDEETLLAFQNLTEQEADEVQEDLGDMDSKTISHSDREKLLDPGISAIEVEEVLVDAWEMHQEEEYEVMEEDDVE